jgi:4-hydroxy-3-methylbut-2-enyl diphosphate reductase
VFFETAEVVKKNSGLAVVSDTICAPTKQRQTETIEEAAKADLVIVVGAKHSANTARLAKLCAELAPKAVLVESEEELKNIDLISPARIFITAGASTPNWMIEKVFDTVRGVRAKRHYMPQTIIKNMASFFTRSSLYTAFAAVALTYVAMKLQGNLFNPRLLALSFLFVFSLTVVNRSVGRAGGSKVSKRELLRGSLAGAAALACALMRRDVFFITAFLLLLGMLYPFRYYLGLKKMTSFPGTKDIVTALGWGFVCACAPALSNDALFSKANYLAVFYAVLLVFTRSVILGIGAANRDIMIGRESFYKAFGLNAARAAAAVAVLLTSCALMALLGMEWKTRLVALLLAGNLYVALAAFWCCYRPRPGGPFEDILVDGQFYVLAVLAFLSRFI